MSFKSVSCRNDSVALACIRSRVRPEQEVVKRAPTSPYSAIADPAVAAAGIEDLQVKRSHLLWPLDDS